MSMKSVIAAEQLPIQKQANGSGLVYRPDIDGMRAVAVLSVLGFHAFPAVVPGGFIGVDVFFVISGFLISGIIFDGLENNRFSFGHFYSRRIKRILPALVLVLAASYIFGWFKLMADEYAELSLNIAGGAGFISNFIARQGLGYFGNLDRNPLLHLWSLGVEEQFYILWPLTLWLLWKRRISFVRMALFIGLISFVFNVSGVGGQATSFYLPGSRFWEMVLGAIFAHVQLRKQDWYLVRRVFNVTDALGRQRPRVADALGAAGAS